LNTESLTSSRSKSSSDKSDDDPLHARHTSGCSSDQYFIRSRTNSDPKGVDLLEPDQSPLVVLAYSSSSLSMAVNDAQHKDSSLQSNGHESFERLFNPSQYLEDDLPNEKLNVCSMLGSVGETLKKIFPFLNTKRTMVVPADSIPKQIRVSSSQRYRISAQRRRQRRSRRAGQ